ncbi:hypothetical protein ACFYOT_38050 [Saccharothrix saharensis]|uniref:hypothetical protein n=1 Tax=Saccharothrix saharensis TaxID=571190 RepID=UPI003675876C
MGLAVRRAHQEVRAFQAARPDVEELPAGSLPKWLAHRYTGRMRLMSLAHLVTGIGVLVGAPDPWYLDVAGWLIVLFAAMALFGSLLTGVTRRAEASRFRVHGPDEVDTLLASGTPLRGGPWWPVVLDFGSSVLMLGIPLVAAALVRESEPVTAAMTAGCAVLAALLEIGLSAHMARWQADFLREEGLELPPVREEWRILVR